MQRTHRTPTYVYVDTPSYVVILKTHLVANAGTPPETPVEGRTQVSRMYYVRNATQVPVEPTNYVYPRLMYAKACFNTIMYHVSKWEAFQTGKKRQCCINGTYEIIEKPG